LENDGLIPRKCRFATAYDVDFDFVATFLTCYNISYDTILSNRRTHATISPFYFFFPLELALRAGAFHATSPGRSFISYYASLLKYRPTLAENTYRYTAREFNIERH
jgi:hypothetical protein